jgi:hypothetical protein
MTKEAAVSIARSLGERNAHGEGCFGDATRVVRLSKEFGPEVLEGWCQGWEGVRKEEKEERS